MTDSKFAPTPTPDTRDYWEAAAEGRLSLPFCSDCGPFFYPRDCCPRCGAPIAGWREMSGRASLVSYVINHRAAPGFDGDVPYVVAVVELEEGPRMLSNIVGVVPSPDHLELDMPLVVRFDQRGDVAVPVFTPEVDA